VESKLESRFWPGIGVSLLRETVTRGMYCFLIVHRVSMKTVPYTFVHKFDKYLPILQIFSVVFSMKFATKCLS